MIIFHCFSLSSSKLLFESKELLQKYEKIELISKTKDNIYFFTVTYEGKKRFVQIIELFDNDLINIWIKFMGNEAKLMNLPNINSYIKYKSRTVDLKKKSLFQFEILYELADANLQSRIKSSKHKRISSKKLISIIKDVANGLVYAKKANCAHLRLIPERILAFDDAYKITGWKKLLFSTSPQVNYIALGNLEYKMGYSAPELIDCIESRKKKKEINIFSCDIYSFGIILLRCCGVPSKKIVKIPIINEELHEEYLKQIMKNYVQNNYSKYISKLIQGMCDFDPDNRETIESVYENIIKIEKKENK